MDRGRGARVGAVAAGRVEDDVAAAARCARPPGGPGGRRASIAAMIASPASISSPARAGSTSRPDVGRGDDRVEVAAERHVVADVAEAGDVDLAVASRAGSAGTLRSVTDARAAVLHRDARLDEAGGRVEPHDRLRLGHLDHPGLDEHRRDADRPVPAHRQAARDLDEQHAPVGVRRASAAAGSRRTSPRGRAARASAAGAGRRCSASKCSLRSSIVSPGSGATPPVTTRVGIPSVWESTAARYAAARRTSRRDRRPARRRALERRSLASSSGEPRRAHRAAGAGRPRPSRP